MCPNLLERIYGIALDFKNSRYNRQTPDCLSYPVISVGNLSVGGSGKTPLVILLAQLLEREGFKPDVLSRGYGRQSVRVERVNPNGDFRRYGDEPLLIARSANIPVFVGASRFKAGRLAESELGEGPEHVHLLDDGFQHRQLARSADIVLIRRSDIHGRLLPAGRLREPLSALRRANVIVLRDEESSLDSELEAYRKAGSFIWRVRRSLSLSPIEGPVVAFCGIAHPAEFFQSLADAGVRVEVKFPFRDHHEYSVRDAEKMRAACSKLGCKTFVTTEKDAVRLGGSLLQVLTAVAPVSVARLTTSLFDESRAVGNLLELIRNKSDGGSGDKSCSRPM
jgi:tetraacyldisaccharide 4'-kinase